MSDADGMQWRKERDEGGFVHYLPTGVEDYVMKVEKSAGGDYYLTAYREGDPAGGEVEYEDTLEKAKRRAEELVQSGEWVDLAVDEDEARAALESRGNSANDSPSP
jgi:hypothetical protein